MQTKFTVTLSDHDAERLAALASTHPAMRIHPTHVAVVRLGLRAIEAAPELLLAELTQIAEERTRVRP